MADETEGTRDEARPEGSGGPTRLALRFLESHPEEGAALLEERPHDEARAVLEQAGPTIAADVLRRAVPAFAVVCLEKLLPEQRAAILDRVPAGESAAWLRRVDEEAREAWLAAMQPVAAEATRRALPFATGTAGALMDAHASALPADLSVAEAADLLRREPKHSAYYLYVVDREGRLLGVVNYRDLLLADPASTVAAVMRTGITSLPAASAGAELVEHPGWRRFLALPVVDAEGRLLGALRHDTVLAHGPGTAPPPALREGRSWWPWRRDASRKREEPSG